MQNRSAIWFFTILLAVAALYSLSFSFFTNSFENSAIEFRDDKMIDLAESLGIDSVKNIPDQQVKMDQFEREYITLNGDEKLVPILNMSYNECKDLELKKGLDLAGGMSAVIELSIGDMVNKMAGNPDEEFRAVIAGAKARQTETEDDFITRFEDVWNENHPQKEMVSVFHSQDTKDLFPLDLTDNSKVVDVLRKQAEDAINNSENIIRARIDKYGVTQPTIQKQAFSGRILVEMPGVKDKDRIRELLITTANLEFWKTYNFRDFQNSFSQANAALATALEGIPENEPDTLESAVEEPEVLTWDVDDPSSYYIDPVTGDTSAVGGDDATVIETAANNSNLLWGGLLKLQSVTKDGQAIGTNKSLWGYAFETDTAKVMEYLDHPSVTPFFPARSNIKFMWANKPNNDGLFPMHAIRVDSEKGKAALEGDIVTNAYQDFDQLNNQVQVLLSMNSEGAARWAEITEEAANNGQDQVAIVLDDQVYSAPNVTTKISGGSSITVGGGTRQEQIKEALDLANILKAGALPAKAEIVNEQIVGSTIGQANIDRGIKSFMIALALILVYMFLYYKGAGLAADIALVSNLFFLVGALASISAALTLPGIAGIILTIGMSVDANVLIFERVKEELRAGAGMQAALNKGYNKAYSAIVDANVTTFLTAVILFLLGSGPIKGFATTLMIGIFTSLFSAIFITRLIFSWRSERKKKLSFYWEYSKNLLANAKFNFVGKRKIFYGVSIVLIGIGMASLFGPGLDLGVDFDGGRKYIIEFNDQIPNDELETLRGTLGTTFAENGNDQIPTIKTVGATGRSLEITTKYLINDKSENVDSRVDDTLRSGLGNFAGGYNDDSLESIKVSPSISDGFKKQSTLAILISLAIIFLYIALRFRKWQFGLGAIAAMAHDVLLVLGLFSIGYKFFPFSMEIDQAFIAAILTVVGYSINDTVVVFDRIREYLAENRKGEAKSIVNKALNSTLSRTLNTSVSTFIVLLIIFIFGSESIQGFTFALMVGVVVGTYSSLFIATPLVVDLTPNLGNRTS